MLYVIVIILHFTLVTDYLLFHFPKFKIDIIINLSVCHVCISPIFIVNNVRVLNFFIARTNLYNI